MRREIEMKPTLLDKEGNTLLIDDWVIYETAPTSLLKNLPASDQAAIKKQELKPIKIIGFDAYGHAELEFLDEQGILHSIWIDAKTILKVNLEESLNFKD